ncbi:GNAT family N-acetyltransferase [Streptococcus didelphis]|uniref:GNAT family N-acetyltransferase n=1 Tax=Streptococcus didelphis TaxID=102886 RepID=UPI00036DD484|nr:GNAT family N-acetyltransferase [Streptococcus didelphis]WMB29378.1 GNAT family N-acetyltransferase [Streptococcus didelphis]
MIIKQTRNTLAKTYLDALKIRQTVFVKEQGVPSSLEIDKDEAHCLYFTVYDDIGNPCATCRLLFSKDNQSATLQRMAVLEAYRGDKIGQTLIGYVMDYAGLQGVQKIQLHAQLSAQSFYAKLGFLPHGQIFSEAGIDHITMEKAL